MANEKTPRVNQHEIIAEIAADLGMTKRQVYDVYDALWNKTIDRLKEGKNVLFTQLIQFVNIDRDARTVKDADGNVKNEIAAKSVVRARVMKRFHDLTVVHDNAGAGADTDA